MLGIWDVEIGEDASTIEMVSDDSLWKPGLINSVNDDDADVEIQEPVKASIFILKY